MDSRDRTNAGQRRQARPPQGRGRDRSSNGAAERRPPAGPREKPPADLPRWLGEELAATTAPARVEKAYALALGLLSGTLDAGDTLQFATALREAAPRSATARELAGLAEYSAGDFAAARADLTAFRRLTGRTAHDVVLADCHRAEGRPEKAVEVLESAKPAETKAKLEAALVMAGAYSDMGREEAAAAALRLAGIPAVEIPPPGSLRRAVRPSPPPPRRKR